MKNNVIKVIVMIVFLFVILQGGDNMALTRPSTSTNNIQSLSDRPNQQDGLTPAQLKLKFDQYGIDNNEYLENLVDEIEAQFATKDENNLKANSDDVYTKTEVNTNFATKTEVQNVVLGQIPDGSLTDDKLSNEAGQLKDKVNSHLAENVDNFNVVDWELNNKGRKSRGLVTFITDDANVADYTVLKDIFAAENVPCCTAVPANKVEINDVSTCSLDQLQELQNAYGWEILSHSYTHAHLTTLTDEEVEAELKNSKEWLNNNGLKCQSFAVPYGEYGTREKLLAKKYYRSMRTSVYGLTDANISSINESPIETHELRSIWIPQGTTVTIDAESGLSNQSIEYYQYYIDKALANNAWLIISMHSWDIRDSNKSALLTSIIQYAKSKMPVVTVRDALNIIGNIVEIGDYSRGASGRTKNYFAIGADGKIEKNGFEQVFLGTDTKKASDAITTFPKNKISLNFISNSFGTTANGFPVNSGGTLYTYNLALKGTDALDYNRQIYITFTNDIYIRKHGSSDWGTWTKVGDAPIKVPSVDAYTDATPIGSFPIGVSYTRIQTANAANFPEAKGGVLITYNLHQIAGALGFNWQEYHIYASNAVYKRTVASDGTFGTWTKISAV